MALLYFLFIYGEIYLPTYLSGIYSRDNISRKSPTHAHIPYERVYVAPGICLGWNCTGTLALSRFDINFKYWYLVCLGWIGTRLYWKLPLSRFAMHIYMLGENVYV